MDIKTLEMFMRIAEGNTFSFVAAESNISQSSLSKEIAKLEAETGVQLLDRSHQKASLTPAGKAFYNGLRSLMPSFHHLLSDVKKYSYVRNFSVCILPPTIYELNELFSSFMLEHPGNTINIYKSTQIDDVMNQVKNHNLDFVITHLPIVENHLAYQFLHEDSLVAVMSESHPLADHDSLTIEDISKYKCVIRKMIKNFLDRDQLSSSILNHLFIYQDSDMDRLRRISEIRSGKYMSIFFASDLLQLRLDGLRVIPINGYQKISVVIAYSEDSLSEKDGEVLIQYLQEKLTNSYYTLKV